VRVRMQDRDGVVQIRRINPENFDAERMEHVEERCLYAK